MSSSGKVIKPPIEEIARGKVFRPSKKFRNKQWFLGIFTVVILWIIIVASMTFVFWMVELVLQSPGYLAVSVGMFWVPLNFWYWLIAGSILIPYLIVYPIYLRAFEYSVMGEEGRTSPEIYVRKGLINITQKHVPYRTITNISSRAGVFDRLFGIGNIEIETAGQSGPSFSSAEEKLEGLTFYEELRDYILMELRKFKEPYVTGTEISRKYEDEIITVGASPIEDEILSVLREIRDYLRDERD